MGYVKVRKTRWINVALTNNIIVIRADIRKVHRPTFEGVPDVQAAGSIVSNAVAKPTIIEKPVTPAVIEANVTAARASVETCPMEITAAMDREYSSICVLYELMRLDPLCEVRNTRKDWCRIS